MEYYLAGKMDAMKAAMLVADWVDYLVASMA